MGARVLALGQEIVKNLIKSIFLLETNVEPKIPNMGTTTTALTGKVQMSQRQAYEMHSGNTIEAWVTLNGLDSGRTERLPVRKAESYGAWLNPNATVEGTTVWDKTQYTIKIKFTNYFNEAVDGEFEMEEVTADRDTAKD